MYPQSLHLYGPFELNAFNALIMLGIGVFIKAALNHPNREDFISKTDFINISLEAALAGIAGGRLLHLISDWQSYPSWYDMLSIWNGGLSILGALIGVLTYSIISLTSKKIPIRAASDIAALYAPLIPAIARIGCFLTGCCYGAPTQVPWAITYLNPHAIAPLHIKIHPTQLYSSMLSLVLFFILQLLSTKYKVGTGKLLMLYLMGMSLERIVVDFFRGDRIMVTHTLGAFFSFHQWIAFAIFSTSFLGFLYLNYTQRCDSPYAKA